MAAWRPALAAFVQNGVLAFFKWFDHTSWYPLGRPIGTTTYPGMQLLSVSAWQVLRLSGLEITLNDVCAFTPVWLGAAGMPRQFEDCIQLGQL